MAAKEEWTARITGFTRQQVDGQVVVYAKLDRDPARTIALVLDVDELSWLPATLDKYRAEPEAARPPSWVELHAAREETDA